MARRSILLSSLAVSWLLLTPITGAQDTAPGKPSAAAPAQGDQITLNFQDVDIRALINTVSEVSGRNFIVDPRVKGKVTLVSGGPLDAEQIYNVFLSVLEVHNFSAVPSGSVIKIIPSNIVKQQPTPTVYSDTAGTSDDQVTQVYQLKHASVQDLVPILRPLLPPTSHFAAHAPTNTLVFTDTRANVQRLLDIITRVDIPDRRTSIHVVYLKHAQASSMAPVLEQLTVGMARQGDPKAPSRNLTVQGDDATNALIINAPDAEFQLLQAVIDQLDIERPDVGDVHVVYLRYAKASELVELLNQISRRETAATDAQQGARAAEVVVQADDATNALVIHAKEDNFRTMKSVIDRLDVRREQVFVETIIAEVSATKASDLGVEWQFRDTNTPTGETTGSTNFSDITGGLTLGYLNNLVESVTGAIVPDLSVVLRALRTDANTNILSTPNLLTLDNETAEIVVAQEVPFVTGQFTTNVDTGTAVTTTTDTGDGAAVTQNLVNPFQTIERKDVGLTLQITPQINEGNTIRLEINQEISNVSQQPVEGATDVVTDKRMITATVQVDDGQIIVLGGLIRDDVVDSVEWVPILGKIPVLGALFRRKSKETRKINLMVFLRPKIIRSNTDIAGFTRDKYGYIQDLERSSQQDTKMMIQGGQPTVLPDIDWEAQVDEPPEAQQDESSASSATNESSQ
jgi:general secretion pathway protein D